MDIGLEDALHAAKLPVSEIARRAGLHRSTMHRAVGAEHNLRLGTLEEIALACGLQAEVTYRRLSDPDAADAAVLLLDGVEDLHKAPKGVQDWAKRLGRYAGEDSNKIALEAAAASTLLHRQGAIGMSGGGTLTPDRLASAGYSSEGPWALSGAVALDAMGGAPHGVMVMWSSDPKRISQLLADSAQRDSLGECELVIAQPGRYTLSGSVNVGGVHLVSPTQAIIDNLGLREQQRAEALSFMGVE